MICNFYSFFSSVCYFLAENNKKVFIMLLLLLSWVMIKLQSEIVQIKQLDLLMHRNGNIVYYIHDKQPCLNNLCI